MLFNLTIILKFTSGSVLHCQFLVAVCIVLTLSVFWLPPSASEKFMLSGITAVIISLFLVHFAQRLPTMAVHTPIIGKYSETFNIYVRFV